MRIIGGKYKGRKIEPPQGFTSRATTDFAREGLFDILQNRLDFEACDVLDLFSGTGSISYEFASRGAHLVHLVEKNSRHINHIRQTIRDMGFENMKPVHIDVKAFLKTCSLKYDIVFADPPYDLLWFDEVPDMVLNAHVIKDSGIFILEHPKKMSFSGHPLCCEHRSYGSVNFSFFHVSA